MPLTLHRLVIGLLLVAGSCLAVAQDKGCAAGRDGKLVCPAPDSTCINDRNGAVVCSTPGGGIEVDRYGLPLCGPGYCTKDSRGEVFCSNTVRGAASSDLYGVPACAGRCVAASPSACVRPVPAK
nr:hypothetical protein [uncultured Roseateles sp.]